MTIALAGCPLELRVAIGVLAENKASISGDAIKPEKDQAEPCDQNMKKRELHVEWGNHSRARAVEIERAGNARLVALCVNSHARTFPEVWPHESLLISECFEPPSDDLDEQ